MKLTSAIPRTIALTVLTGVALVGCAAPEGEDEAREITIAGNAIEANYDPTNGALIWTIEYGQPVYESLIVVNTTTQEYEPWLAESFEVSDDRKKVTFHLREDVTFTDGEPLTAEGVVKEFDMVMASGLHFSVSPMKAFGAVASAEDGNTFVIETDTGVSEAFFDAITYLPIVSPVALDDLESLKDQPVGTGPYVIEERIPDVSITYTRNPGYWNPELYDFDRVTVQVFADRIAALNALKSGQVDAAEISIGDVGAAEAAGFHVSRGIGPVFGLAWTDWSGSIDPRLSDVRVRQALSYALDREGINEALNLGEGRVTSQTFVEGQPQYIEGGEDYYTYDVERAKELLAEAGYPDGLELSITSGVSKYEPVVQQALADIGVMVNWIKPEALASLDDTFKYPLHLIELAAHGLVTWVSEGGYLTNFGAVPPAPIVAELTDRMANGDEAERTEAAQEFGRVVLEEAWYIVVSAEPRLWALEDGYELELGTRYGWPTPLKNFSAAD